MDGEEPDPDEPASPSYFYGLWPRWLRDGGQGEDAVQPVAEAVRAGAE
jgi:hypothetical protein